MSLRALYILLAFMLFYPLVPAYSINGDNGENNGKPLYMPFTEISLSGKYYTPYKNSYQAAYDMFLLTEFYSKGPLSLSFDFTGTTPLRKDDGNLEPDLLFYRMNYLTARWRTGYGFAGIFFDHICNNRININGSEEDMIRWYGAGLLWEAPGFSGSDKLRYMDNLPYLTGSLSASYGWSTQLYPYRFHISGTIRFIGPVIFSLSPYLEGTMFWKLGEEKNYDGKSEAGLSYRWRGGDAAAFTGVETVRGTSGYYDGGKLNHFTGIRFTSWIIDDETGGVQEPGKGDIHPRLYFNGTYGKYINNDLLNYHADLHTVFYFPVLQEFGLYGSARLQHDSLLEDNGMYPRFIQHRYEGGFNLSPGNLNFTLVPYTQFRRYEEGNTFDGYSEYYASAGLRMINTVYQGDSQMMHNRSVADNGWLPLISLSIEKVFQDNRFPVKWILLVKISQWLFREDSFGINISGTYLRYFNELEGSEYSIEPSVVIGRKGYFRIFYRYDFRERSMEHNGIFRTGHLAGLKIAI